MLKSSIEGSVPDHAVNDRRLVMNVTDGPGRPGLYRLLSEEEWFALDTLNPLPVFLHEANESNLVTWLELLPYPNREAAVAEHVRKAVFELVEARVPGRGRLFGQPCRDLY